MRKAILSPVTSVIAALISIATISVAVRSGQSAQLVGYGVGVSIGGLLFVLFSFGTNLAFITGDVKIQRAARAVRVRVTLPLGLSGVIAGSVAYSYISEVPAAPLIAGGLSATLIALTEFESAYMKRHLRTATIMAIETSSRVLGLLLVVEGTGFSYALLAVAGVRFMALFFVAREDPSREGVLSSPIRVALNSAVRPSLLSSSALYALIDRSIFLVFPLIAPQVTSAYFTAMMTSQQSVSAALAAGLQTSLAARSQSRVGEEKSPNWYNRFDRLTVGVSAVLACGGIILAGIPLGILGIPLDREYGLMWAMVMLAMPLATAGRAAQYRLMSELRQRRALASIGAGATTLSVFLLISLSTDSWQLAVGGVVVAEGCATLVGRRLLRTRDG